MRISVAIASCGRPEALRTCLAAIAAQTRAPDQIIIVEQDPSPETREVVAQSGLTIEYREQERLGLSVSRNLALSLASGDVLAVTDDDCFPDRRWIAELLAGFSAPAAPDAVTGPVLPPAGDPPKGMWALSMRPSRETHLFSSRVIPWLVGSGGNFAARVDVLREIGGWDKRLGPGTGGNAGEDVEIFDRLLAAGHSILYQGNAAVHHAWQTGERRQATRWSYAYGIGALVGMRLRQGDRYGWRILARYSKMRLRELLREARLRRWTGVRERVTALSALCPSMIYGLRAPVPDPPQMERETRA